ncbi:uncharacterized protein TNCV_1088021 [Trichonephila clavipes]|uniref:Uncharacterized protein n=1 Tax=Trichonephila clavipes TaxID=2585209 RepID=A0A8X6ST97_TRICX|nr:uncharacterized protein TNCV_1088021 [Trichonephila clavipes]
MSNFNAFHESFFSDRRQAKQPMDWEVVPFLPEVSAPFVPSRSPWKMRSLISVQFTCRNCGGGDRGRVAIYRPFGEVSLSLNRTVTCMVLKANDRRTSCPCHDEFRGPRSDYVRQVALATTTTTTINRLVKFTYRLKDGYI